MSDMKRREFMIPRLAARGARFGDSLCGQLTGILSLRREWRQVCGADLNCSEAGRGR